MLRAIRHKLRQIRYYSAPRRRTMWTAATDTALWLALLLAIPFTAASLWVPRDSSVRFSLEGVLLQPERGEFEARVMNPDTEVGTWKPQEPFGMFVLSQSQRQWGWPFPVQIDVEPVELLLDIFNQPQPQRRASSARRIRFGWPSKPHCWRPTRRRCWNSGSCAIPPPHTSGGAG